MTTPTEIDWYAWHEAYDDLLSPQTLRLAAVQDAITAFLDAAPAGPLRVLSLAAGQSRDLLPLLIRHPRGRDVRACLVERDERNGEFAEGAAHSAALAGVRIVVGDGGLSDTYAGLVPADLVIASGVLDYLGEDDLARTAGLLPMLCAPDATLVWSATGPGTAVADALAAAGFRETRRSAHDFVVAIARLTAAPSPLRPGLRMFSWR